MAAAGPPWYVNIGCGQDVAPGWLNLDSSPTLKIERLPVIGALKAALRGRVFPRGAAPGDLTRGLALDDGSCKAIYASHVLEHLARDEATAALAEMRRLLAPDGLLRIVVPDLELAARRYLETLDGPAAATAAADFLGATLLGEDSRPRSAGAFLRAWLGRSRHLWMWDADALTAALAEAGFAEVRRAAFNDSAEPRFAEVERVERFEAAVAVEAGGAWP